MPIAEDGCLNVFIEVEINSEESLEPFREFGINNPKMTLVFQDCSQVTAILIGFCTGREVMSTFEIIELSELEQKLHAIGVGSETMIHFRIQGSHGSQLDFVGGTFSVAEQKMEQPHTS